MVILRYSTHWGEISNHRSLAEVNQTPAFYYPRKLRWSQSLGTANGNVRHRMTASTSLTADNLKQGGKKNMHFFFNHWVFNRTLYTYQHFIFWHLICLRLAVFMIMNMDICMLNNYIIIYIINTVSTIYF